jgi:hypothetical protein
MSPATFESLGEHNHSRGLLFGSPLQVVAAAPGATYSPGVHLDCYGPFFPPDGARSLKSFLPEVNMSIVHHMIMFGGSGHTAYRGQRPALRNQLCNQGNIIYAWARTGQKTPLPLDFEAAGHKGDAFPVGPGTPTEWIALQIHYQQMHTKPVRDSSGVRLTFSTEAPRRPLAVELMASGRLRIPARAYMDECMTCRINSGGTVAAWRVHAHRLSLDVWSDHFDKDGRELPQVGRISAQVQRVHTDTSSLSCFSHECLGEVYLWSRRGLLMASARFTYGLGEAS